MTRCDIDKFEYSAMRISIFAVPATYYISTANYPDAERVIWIDAQWKQRIGF